MRSFPWLRIIAVLLILIWAVYEIQPSWVWYSLPKEQQMNSRTMRSLLLRRRLPISRSNGSSRYPEKRADISSQIADLSQKIDEQKKKLEDLQNRAIPLGLDLKGGVHVVLKVVMAETRTSRRSRNPKNNKIAVS